MGIFKFKDEYSIKLVFDEDLLNEVGSFKVKLKIKKKEIILYIRDSTSGGSGGKQSPHIANPTVKLIDPTKYGKGIPFTIPKNTGGASDYASTVTAEEKRKVPSEVYKAVCSFISKNADDLNLYWKNPNDDKKQAEARERLERAVEE